MTNSTWIKMLVVQPGLLLLGAVVSTSSPAIAQLSYSAADNNNSSTQTVITELESQSSTVEINTNTTQANTDSSINVTKSDLILDQTKAEEISSTPNQAETTQLETQSLTEVEVNTETNVEPLTNTNDANVTPTQTTETTDDYSEYLPQIEILTPAQGTRLDSYSSSVVVQYPDGAIVDLRVNGKPVDSSLVGRTEVNPATGVVTQVWYGVVFKSGKNTLTATGVMDDVLLPTAEVEVMVAGAATQIELATREARVPADGNSTVKVVGLFTDDDGNPTKWNTVVTLYSSSGEFVGVDQNPDLKGFQVESINGEFVATLRSSREAGTVTIKAEAFSVEAYTQVQFTTLLRDQPIVTGFVDFRFGNEGTDFYDRFGDFLPLDSENEFGLDIDSAGFGTGSIGEWQITAAFNTDRDINETEQEDDNRLFGGFQSSELEYPTYGDSSSVEKVTPSTDGIFFNIERSSEIENAEPDYLRWGDYRTEEFSRSSQQFSAIDRDLHGLKLNYNFGNLQVTGLFANNIEGFQRDTIAPDGTSGFYFLSRRLVQPGSEQVFIEAQELNQPGVIVQRRKLRRGVDYQIDYDRGSLLFNQPIFRTSVNDEAEVLVNQIVVTYQFEDEEGEDTDIYAARATYHFNREVNQQSWVGATFLTESMGERDFEIYGLDTYVSLGEDAAFIAEYAHSSNSSQFSGPVSGSAYRMELFGNLTDDIKGRAYFRSTEEGFSNNATVSFVPGQTIYGADATAKVADGTNLRFRFERQDNFGVAPRPLDTLQEFLEPLTEPIPGTEVDNSLTTISAGVEQRIGDGSLLVDLIYRDRQDNLAPEALDSTSTQLRSLFKHPITDNLSVYALNEFTLTDEEDAVYSDRTAVGLDWEVYDGISVFLSQQWFTSGQYEGESITNLGVKAEYEPWENATISGNYSIVGGANGMSGQGAIGIGQTIPITSGLKVNFGYEHVFENTLARTGSGVPFLQPFAFGQSSSGVGITEGDSYNLGIEYTGSPDFKASASFEHRENSRGSNTVITADAIGKVAKELTAIASYQQASSSNQLLEDLGTTRELQLGLAYRDPDDDTFNALFRYEYRKNPALIPDTILFGDGTGSEEHLLAAEAIYAPSWDWEFYGKVAYRNSKTYLADDFVGDTSVYLGQLRATYRFAYDFDIVGEARFISQPSADYTETGLLVELGYYVSPDLRIYGGYTFGDVDDGDFGGSRSADGFHFGVTVKLDSIFDNFGQPQFKERPEDELVQQTDSNEIELNKVSKLEEPFTITRDTNLDLSTEVIINQTEPSEEDLLSQTNDNELDIVLDKFPKPTDNYTLTLEPKYQQLINLQFNPLPEEVTPLTLEELIGQTNTELEIVLNKLPKSVDSFNLSLETPRQMNIEPNPEAASSPKIDQTVSQIERELEPEKLTISEKVTVSQNHNYQ